MPEIAVAVVSALITFSIGYGMSKTKLEDLLERVKDLEMESKKALDRHHSLHETYVSQQHFNEIMGGIKETVRDLKEGMNKILELLTSR